MQIWKNRGRRGGSKGCELEAIVEADNWRIYLHPIKVTRLNLMTILPASDREKSGSYSVLMQVLNLLRATSSECLNSEFLESE